MINKVFKILYIILIIVFAVSFFQLKKLPSKDKLLVSMFNEPIQATSTILKDFDFSYKNIDYEVKPLADYELWGLVVTTNDIKKWYNMYHDKNSVNLKDVCVIWGDNLRNNTYHNIHFKSGEWTCYTRWYRPLDGKFYHNKISNNHLLSDSKQIRQVIRQVRIGDQIHIKGALVDYAKKGSSWYRRTSLSREDTNHTSRSGGACEVFFVNKFEILKRGMPMWYFLNDWSKKIFIFLIFLEIIIFIKKIKKESKMLKKYINK